MPQNAKLNTERFITSYVKHYPKKQIPPFSRPKTKQQFYDPLTEGFKEHLSVQSDETQALENFKRDKAKAAQIYFSTPFSKDTINYQYNYDRGKTVYQVEYCDIVEDIKKKQEIKAKRLVLPSDWNIPLTTQKYAFRDPVSLSKDALEKSQPLKAADNLGQDEQINRILNVTTGISEYMDVIGNLGEFIVTEQMHGQIVHE